MRTGYLFLAFMLLVCTNVNAQAPAQDNFTFKRTVGEWMTIGRKIADGGFMCATSHIISGKPMTMFTGLQINPPYVHQNIFMPTSMPDGTVMNTTITLPDGSVNDVGESHVTGNLLIVPLNVIILKSVGDAISSEKPVTITSNTPSGDTETGIFTMNGAPQAAVFHTECIKSFYTPQPVAAQEQPSFSRGY